MNSALIAATHSPARLAARRTPLWATPWLALCVLVAMFPAPLVGAAGAGAAFQAETSIVVRIAGPSVTYVIDGCPDLATADDLNSFGLTFSTTDPTGSVDTKNGLRTGDRKFSLTTDIRSDNPDGQYGVGAVCTAADGSVVKDFGSAAFWVADGKPSNDPVTPGVSDPESTDGTTAPEESDPPSSENPEAPAQASDDPAESATDTSDPDQLDPETQTSDAAPTAAPESDDSSATSNAADTASNDAAPKDDSASGEAVETPTPSSNADEALTDDTGGGAGALPSSTPTPNSPPQAGSTSSSESSPEPLGAAGSVQVQPAAATSGETVKTWVQGCPATVDGAPSAVAFVIMSPSGSQKVATALAPGSDGSFSIAIRVPDSPEVGTYSITASCGLETNGQFTGRRSYREASFEVFTSVGLDLATVKPDRGSTNPNARAQNTSAAESRAALPEIGFTG